MHWTTITKSLIVITIKYTNTLIKEYTNTLIKEYTTRKTTNYKILAMSNTAPRPVYISGYDLSKGALQFLPIAQQLNIKHIWHTCIELDNTEYYFQNGIQKIPLQNTTQEIFVEGFTEKNEKAIIKKTLYISQRYQIPLTQELVGYTYLNDDEVNEVIESILQEKYNSESYNLIYNNCNNFSNEMLYLICFKTVGVPKYILEVPKIFVEAKLHENPILASVLQIVPSGMVQFEQHDNLSMSFKYVNENHLDLSHLVLSEEEEKLLYFKMRFKPVSEIKRPVVVDVKEVEEVNEETDKK